MKLNILSLFDGMSCGQQALERAGIEVDNYFASEIDKYAMQVTMANYPDTKQLGSVVNVNGSDLPKIDLLIGGSPCQSFSFAGKRKGMATKCETEILTLNHYLELKADGYEFEGQSYLFWEFMRLLNECKPTYFLLENVEMGVKWEKVLSKAIGVNGIHINSALVSAQNRKRIYWTNIGMQPGGLFGDLVSIIEKPKDKGILLKDVLESQVDDKYFLSGKMISYFNNRAANFNQGKINIREEYQKSSCLTSSMASCDISDNYIKIDKKGKIKENQDKASCFTAGGHSGGNHSDMDLIVHNMMPRSGNPVKGGTGHLSRNDGKTYFLDTGNTNAVEIVGLTEVRTQEAKQIRKETGTNPKRAKELILRTDGKIGAILTSQTPDNLVISMDYRYDEGFRQRENGKSPTLTITNDSNGFSGKPLAMINNKIRRLTPLECERLQTVKDNYTNHVSDSQRYKMLGNGWTVDVIAHIFSYLK
jgi:DNA-cytosine methyltransferase